MQIKHHLFGLAVKELPKVYRMLTLHPVPKPQGSGFLSKASTFYLSQVQGWWLSWMFVC